MSHSLSKLLNLLTALFVGSFTSAVTAREPISLSPASAELQGLEIATTQTAAGDVSFIHGFTKGPERARYIFQSSGGLYQAVLTYRAAAHKGYELEVNGIIYEATVEGTGGRFAASSPVPLLLQRGKNSLSIGGGWGAYDIEQIDLRPTDLPEPPAPPGAGPADQQATPQAKALWQKLATSYGKGTFSGVDATADLCYVKEKTSNTPAMLMADLIDYSPSRVEHGAKSDITPDTLIQLARRGEMLDIMWHWNAPTDLIDDAGKTDSLPMKQRWYMGFYAEGSTFDFSTALADETCANYKLLLRDIDAIAVPLNALQEAGVAITWRPLHEAEGGWFWWGTRGPENYIRLWRLLYDRLTNYHHLHNMLWVFTAATNPAWYPGDDVVDIIGVDCYPKDNHDPLSCLWLSEFRRYGNKKLLALSEVGFVPDIEFQRKVGVYFSYYCTWNDMLGPRNLADDELKRRINSPVVFNLEH